MNRLYINRDWSTLKKLLALKAAGGGSVPQTGTATGSLVTFNTTKALPLIECEVGIEPVQEGTGDPSPSNVRPISGRTGVTVYRTGKNLIDDTIKYVVGDTTVFVGANNNNYNIYLKAGTYTISCVFADDYGMFYREQNDNANKALWNSGSPTRSAGFTTESGGYYRFWVYRNAQAGGVDPSGVISVQLELGSTATTYEPYTGQTVEVQFPDSAGTVYGGTLDVTTGELVVDWAMVDLGMLTWRVDPNRPTVKYSSSLKDLIFRESPWANALCSVYALYKNGPDTLSSGQFSTTNAYGAGNIFFKDEAFNGKTGAEVKEYLTGVQLVYELADPTIYQLTPSEIKTLVGENNIWADTGDITVKYYK